ncbi:DExH-box splicing factor binding site-domain-containing protein [Aspergillus bertholletiae]|uniref:Pre-mRNA-splicing factor n=1 Tax=Aspergillus bertholletiae TaxID=1226010 RepID=A0A5N7AUE4_9EURO|nr:DExH-box splicing factor binding site-domain-containing protein [Aspergillus bertholletiae]
MSSHSPRDSHKRSQGLSKPFSLSLGGGSSASNGQTKKTSFNLQGSTRGTNPPGRSLARRPHHLHDDDESDEEERAPVHEAVTEFDTESGTAVSGDKKHEKHELVIPVLSSNNWRDRPGVNQKPKGKNLLPKEVQAIQEATKRGEITGENTETDGPSMAYGLSFAQQPGTEQETEDEAGDKPVEDSQPISEENQKPLTQDEIALRALIRESKGETEGRSDLIIESRPGGQDGNGGRHDETTSFRADIASRPESATLDQYNAIPVEEFGAALLRGMGWKEGKAVGKGTYGSSAIVDKPRIPERRPGFLGIGAKDVSGGKGAEAELGAWGKAAMRKGARKNGKEGETSTEGVYMPVMMRNKKTGESITEEELAATQKEAKPKRDDDEWKERRDRNLERSGRDRDRDKDYRRRDYERDDDDRYDRRKTGSSRRDRSHSRRRKHDDDGDSRDDRSYRDRDRDYDRERRRDRDRSREREKDRERSRRYRGDDRHGSSRHSSNTSSRHGRDRDQDRDRDNDRDSHRRRRHDDRYLP